MTKFICPGRAGPVFRHDPFYILSNFSPQALFLDSIIGGYDMYSAAYCLVFRSKASSACPHTGTLSIPARLVGRLGFRSKG